MGQTSVAVGDTSPLFYLHCIGQLLPRSSSTSRAFPGDFYRLGQARSAGLTPRRNLPKP